MLNSVGRASHICYWKGGATPKSESREFKIWRRGITTPEPSLRQVLMRSIRLNEQGYPLGLKLLDLLLHRSTPPANTSSSTAPASRPLRLIPLLPLLTPKLYPLLDARPADSLDQSS